MVGQAFLDQGLHAVVEGVSRYPLMFAEDALFAADLALLGSHSPLFIANTLNTFWSDGGFHFLCKLLLPAAQGGLLCSELSLLCA